ncbi:hypothetical protein E6A50_11955 [Brachyspira hampsonii]|nr:hypothetical protein [Brachyspira hampsonii]
MFILSCNDKTISNSTPEVIGDGDIIYYDPASAETNKYSFYKFDHAKGDKINVENTFKKIAESKKVILYLEDGVSRTKDDILNFLSEFEKDYPKKLIYTESLQI